MLERERQSVSGWPNLDELLLRTNEGWKLVAMEWEREGASTGTPTGPASVELPYGFRASPDGFHMVEEPIERRVMMIVLNSIVDDRPLSEAAADLNRAGFSNRNGQPWTPAAVFDLLPTLVDAGPRIFNSRDWIVQRAQRNSRAS